MKNFIALLFFCLLFTGCKEHDMWCKEFDSNKVTIEHSGEWLNISVFVPEKNLDEFNESDAYTELLMEAFTDYLKLSDKAKFECPELETVSEKTEKNGRTMKFRIPKKALKVIKK